MGACHKKLEWQGEWVTPSPYGIVSFPLNRLEITSPNRNLRWFPTPTRSLKDQLCPISGIRVSRVSNLLMMRYALSLLASAAPTARVAGGMRHAAALHTSRAHLHTPTQHMLSSWRQRGVESSRRAAFASQSEGRVAPLEEVPYNKDKYNTVSLIGNLGGDVDLRYLESGSKTATMAMAVSRKTKPAFW